MRRIPRGVARALVASAVLAAGLVPAAAQLVAAETTALSPSMTVNPVTISAGDKVTVIGEGWPAGQLVDLSICGNGGDGGSANCNRSGAATVGVGDDGRFGATLKGVIPPVACPCVVRGAAGVYTATQPIDVVGAPLRTAPAAVAVPIVTDVQVTGSGPPIAWFGGSPERDVVVTVSNPSESAVKNARVEVRWGSGSEQSTVIPIGQDLLPKTSTQIATTIGLGALTWGDVDVRARVVTTGDPTWVDASTSSYPWGLLVLAIVLLQFLVIAIVRRNRRARLAREGGAGAAEVVGPAPRDDAPAAAAAPVASTTDEVDLTEPAPDPEPAPVSAGAGAAVSTLEREPAGGGRATATQDPSTAGPITAAPWTPRRGT